MDEEFLYKIYCDYYDIGKPQNFKLNTDVEYIQLLASYKEITYTLEKTKNRLYFIYNSIGKKEWNKIFNFDFENMISLIKAIIKRIITYNNLVLDNKGEEYNFYLTKDEIYTYLTIPTTEIETIIEFISIDLNNINDERDCFNLIKFDNDSYTLIFIWDFLYYLYDKIETKIKENSNEKQLSIYYNNRGKIFEKQCTQEIKFAFKNKEIYKNVYYINEKGKNELDILLIIDNKIIVFECKTTNFDIYKTNNNEELEYQIISALGKGYKTINNFDQYIKNKDTIELLDNGKKIQLNLKNKEIIYVCISLNNIEFVQTSIQKLDGTVLKKVNKYPIILNYLDLSSILDLASLNPDPILKYFGERFYTINELKMLSIDIDEIDVLGFLTDEQNARVYNMIKDNSSFVDTNLMITNGAYRNQVNKFLNEKFIYNLYEE